MVRLQQMIKEYKRQRLIDKIVTSGEKLRRLYVARAELYPDDPEIENLNDQIDQRERQHTKLIVQFKETNECTQLEPS